MLTLSPVLSFVNLQASTYQGSLPWLPTERCRDKLVRCKGNTTERTVIMHFGGCGCRGRDLQLQ